MPEAPKIDPALRTTLRVALVCTVLGSCGAANGMGQLMTTSVRSDAGPLDTSDAASHEAATRANEVFVELISHDSMRRVFGAADLGLSLLLVVAGTMLMMRRESAPWWITQAVIANCLFILAQALAVMWRIHAFAPQLATTLDAYLRAASPEQAADAADVPLGMVTTYMMMGMAALWGFVRLAVHGWIAWRVRRPDVRALLAETGREGD